MKYLMLVLLVILAGCSDKKERQEPVELVLVDSYSIGNDGVYQYIQTSFFNDTDNDITAIDCAFRATLSSGALEVVEPVNFDIISGATTFNTVGYFVDGGVVLGMSWACDYMENDKGRSMSGRFDY